MVRILTDSSSDITPAEAAALNIDLVHLSVAFEDGSVLLDGVDISGPEFFARLKTCKRLPKTSQPAPEAFIELFEQAKQACDQMVVLTIGSQLSGTWQCARMAAEDVEYDHAYFVDTGTASIGLRLLVDQAVQLRDAGLPAPEIAGRLEALKARLRILLIVDDLKNLQKGGRLSAAATIAGSALGVKPVLQLCNRKLGLAGKARGLPGAYVAMFKLTGQFAGIDRTLPVYTAYSDKPIAADPICRHLRQNLGIAEPPVFQLGAAIGTHVGCGAAGVAYFTADLPE